MKWTALGFGIAVVLLLIGLSALLIKLDARVQSEFAGRRFNLPARLYARPLELFPGAALTTSRLLFELRHLNYLQVKEPAQPGSYSVDGDQFTVHTRGFEFWDGNQPPRIIDVRLGMGTIDDLRDGSSGASIDLLRLEPMAIGGITGADREDRMLVRYEQLPRHLVDALIATEDRRYFSHPGVDLRAVGRALKAIITGNRLEGGSTITQQLVKNFFLTPERTLSRKFTEMLMALLVERRYDKQDILQTYLNEVFFGQDGARAIHGVGLASQHFFGRSVAQLEPQHSALLVAILKGPSYYNPRRNPERALKRRNLVLQMTHEQGYLAQWEYEQAAASTLGLAADRSSGLASYPAFLEFVFRQLRQNYQAEDLQREGLRIYTTLDPWVQAEAERALSKGLAKLQKRAGVPLEGAIIATEPLTGEVTAMVGGRDAQLSGFNRALDAARPVGSLLKPVVYLAALSHPQRYTLASLVDDSPFIYESAGAPPWEPANYDGEFHGQVPLWRALAHSYNVSAARIGLDIGVDEVLRTVQALGVQTPLRAYPSTVLGASELPPIEVAQLYQTLASGGFQTPLQSIREVMTPDGRQLKRYAIDVKQAAAAAPTFLVNYALQLAVSEGTGRSLRTLLPPGLGAAGKTGTTDDYRDSWFAGFTGNRMAVVWVGSDSNGSTGLTGAAGAMPIWADLISATEPQPLDLPAPEGVEFHSVAAGAEALQSPSCPNAVRLPFVEGSEPSTSVDCRGQPTANPVNKVQRFLRDLLKPR